MSASNSETNQTNKSAPRRRDKVIREHGPRFLKFGAVGLLGVGVNLGMYAIFYEWIGIPDYIARALAIEVSVLHNFAWNFFWTWSDRGGTRHNFWSRLLRYHGSTFVSSFVITLSVGALVDFLLGSFPYVNYISHLIGIGAGMITNYLLSDLWVFKRSTGNE